MRLFTYERPRDVASALAVLARDPHAAPLAGGTALLDLMKQSVEAPATIMDLNFAPELTGVAVTPAGTLRLGAATPLAHVARDPVAETGWPLLHETIVDGLTPQLRNAASIAGNIMQRPRCIYFREPGFACNKKRPGSGCAAQAGVHYTHALFGGAEAAACIAVHPSDLCVALTALEATLDIAGPGGRRTLAIADLHRLPGEDATRETTLRPGELIAAVIVPAQGQRGGCYAKGSEGFALASCAALLDIEGDAIRSARLVLGGVAHRPWRSRPAEAVLAGASASARLFREAAEAALTEAHADAQTGFRLDLLRGVVAEALETALERAKMRVEA